MKKEARDAVSLILHKAVGSKLQLFQSLSVKCLTSSLKKHVHFVETYHNLN